MWKRMHCRLRQMIRGIKSVRADSKFLLLTFLICLIPIGVSSFSNEMSMATNMTNIRNMFLSILGYIIESGSRTEKSKPKEGNQGDKIEENRLKERTDGLIAGMEVKQIEEAIKAVPIQKDLRILITGHLLIIITIILVMGVFVKIDGDNQSLSLLRHSSYACIGFLVSASKGNKT